MPSSRPRAARAPEHAGDDLTQISGIGPATAGRLAGAGVRTYGDLAGRTPEELATILAGIAGHSARRIIASDWVGQARRLAAELPVSPDSAEASISFDLEFLLAADDAVRQTNVHDNQTGIDASWPGWDADRLVGLLRAGLPTRRQHADPGGHVRDAPPLDAPPLLRVAHLTNARPRSSDRAATPDEPTAVGLELIPDQKAASSPTLDYSAAISARRLDGEGEFSIVDLRGMLRVDRGIALAGAGPPLQPGLYRLEATVAAYTTGHAPDDPPLSSQTLTGDIVEVAAHAGETEKGAGRQARSKRLLASGVITESEFAALQAT